MSQEEEVECVDVECCHMCFSTERKLTSLDGVVDIYLLIVGLSPDCEESVNELRSCWECRAVLQRILKFRRQVQWAHNVFVTADALLLDSDMCMSKLKFSGINKINLKRKLDLDTVRDVFIVEIAPQCMENVNKHPFSNNIKSTSDMKSIYGAFVKHDDNKQHIEVNTSANNMCQAKEKTIICSMNTPVDTDPLAIEIKEEDDFDEGDIFDTEPTCYQNQTNIDEQAISNIKTNVTKSNNLISNIKTVEKYDLSQKSNHSPLKPFITSTVIDNPSDGLTKTKQLVVVIDPLNLSKHNLTLREEKVTKFNFKDNLDNNVIATQPPERKANSKSINMVVSMKPQLNIHNISSTSRQSVSMKQLDKIQSNLITVKNISPLQDESQKQILHHSAQHSQIDSTFVKTTPLTKRVLSNNTAQYNVKDYSKPVALTPRELKIVKPEENVEPVLDKTRKNLPENVKESCESFRSDKTKSKLAKIRVLKVTKSELNDFLEQARNNEAYLASPFKCEICILGFKEECFLQRHMVRYRHATISKNKFVCDVCLSRLPSEQELNTHQSIHDSLYSCTREDFTSVLPLNVYHHYFEKHTLNKKCKTSLKLNAQVNQRMKPQAQNFETSQKYKREANLRKVKKIKSIKYEVFKPTLEDFDCMRKRVSLRLLYQCEDCCQPLYSNEKLEEHRKAHSESAGAHVCDMCKLRFTTAELLRQHRPVHDKWYKCKADPACLHVAQKLSTIQSHISNKHRTKPIKKKRPRVSHECNICKKIFTTRQSLKSHMQIHNKQYMCEVCGYVAASSSNLYKHREVHFAGELDYLVCEFCPKRFMSKVRLRYHRSQHLQVKPYACKLCDEKFYCPNSRGKHVRKVHEKKPLVVSKHYKCTLCQMEFKNSCLLVAHRTTHEQEHKCDKCPKSFFFFNQLVSHQESHTYICECDICGKVFANRDTLKFHLNSKHSGGTETQRVKREKLKESSECGKELADRDTLKHRLHSKHSGGTETRVKTEKRKECSECGKEFHSVKKWRDHMKTHLIFPEDTPELS